MFYCIKSTRIWSSKLNIHVGFHHPFATTTTVISPVNKKEPINGFPCILNFPVHIRMIHKLSLISSFIIWVRGYHQKTLIVFPKISQCSQVNNDFKIFQFSLEFSQFPIIPINSKYSKVFYLSSFTCLGINWNPRNSQNSGNSFCKGCCCFQRSMHFSLPFPHIPDGDNFLNENKYTRSVV